MNTTISFLQPVQEDLRAVEALMRAQAEGYHPDLSAALDLLVSSGGKRLRPALTLLTGRMLGGKTEHLVTLGAAIELLHTATLVHDDLIDGSLLRRGIPTLNSQWSPGATVLTGDFLFARAAKLAADTNSIAVNKLFAKTLTIIVNGEITQLFGSRCSLDRQGYFDRIYAKTASLFETSTMSAALVSEVDESTVACLSRYGFEIGMAFQIIDDILDFTGEQATVGKPIGSDLRQGLVTLPALIYIDGHPDDPDVAPLLRGECLKEEARLQRLVEAIRAGGAIESAHDVAEQFVNRGLEQLAVLPESQEKHWLEDLAQFVAERRK